VALDDREVRLVVEKADVMTPEVERGNDKGDEGRLLCAEENGEVVERVKLGGGTLEADVVELFRELVIPRETERLVVSSVAEVELVFGGKVELEKPVVETPLLPRILVRVWMIPPSDEDGGLVIVEDGGPEAEPEMTMVLSVGVVAETPEEPEPRIALVMLPIKLVMGPITPTLLSELEDAVMAGDGTGECVVGPSKEVDGGEAMVDDEGPDIEPGMMVEAPVGVVAETLDEPGPKIALVTPPIKLVMGPRMPPPLSELEDAGDDTGESKEVVLPEDGGETSVGDE